MDTFIKKSYYYNSIYIFVLFIDILLIFIKTFIFFFFASGIYKSDWDTFGGMNEKEFKNKWGGEDWEMVDRVLEQGIEVDKIRMIGFYHFYHTKEGMWT